MAISCFWYRAQKEDIGYRILMVIRSKKRIQDIGYGNILFLVQITKRGYRIQDMGYGIPDIGYCVISYIRYPISYILYPLLSSKSMASSTIDGVVVHNTAGTRKHSILGCASTARILTIYPTVPAAITPQPADPLSPCSKAYDHPLRRWTLNLESLAPPIDSTQFSSRKVYFLECPVSFEIFSRKLSFLKISNL